MPIRIVKSRVCQIIRPPVQISVKPHLVAFGCDRVAKCGCEFTYFFRAKINLLVLFKVIKNRICQVVRLKPSFIKKAKHMPGFACRAGAVSGYIHGIRIEVDTNIDAIRQRTLNVIQELGVILAFQVAAIAASDNGKGHATVLDFRPVDYPIVVRHINANALNATYTNVLASVVGISLVSV